MTARGLALQQVVTRHPGCEARRTASFAVTDDLSFKGEALVDGFGRGRTPAPLPGGSRSQVHREWKSKSDPTTGRRVGSDFPGTDQTRSAGGRNLRKAPRSAKALTAAVGMALIVAACGSSSKNTAATTAGGGTTAATTAPSSGTTVAPGTTVSSGPKAPMTVTIKINKAAVWDDGTPITIKDFQCWNEATLKTPGSLSTVGYDQIDSIAQGATDHDVIIKFKTVYAPYKNLFNELLAFRAV